MSIQDAAARTYLDEAREMLADLEEGLLEIEARPEDLECVARVFRAMHTIKGSGSMFGFEEVARFTHDVETILDQVRAGQIPVTQELLTLTLEAKDHISILLDGPREGTSETRAASDSLLDRFKSVLGTASAPPPSREESCSPEQKDDQPAAAVQETFWVRYRPAKDTFRSGASPLALIEELLELTDKSRVVFHHEEIPALENLDVLAAYGWWDVLLITTRGESAIRDVFIFVEDDGGVEIRHLCQEGVRNNDLESMAEILTSHPQELSSSLFLRMREITATALKLRHAAPTDATATRETGPGQASGPVSGQPAGASSIRVDADRLDNLVNMVGEMVILQARLSIASKGLRSPVITQIAEEMERLAAQLRENTLGMRMLPIGTVYGALRRMVRDVSSKLGKDVDFITDGADTELDKTVIDQLKDPLMHMLRNALDHGIESPQVRERAGKPGRGVVRLSARHSRGDVLIEIRDDGAGIDPEALRAKALEKGLITVDTVLSRKEAMALLFLPGFSTAKEVTGLSGRGVGMDVVKRSIDAIRGTVDIDSTHGQGTTLAIRLPLTLAIIEGLNVLVGEESFILPLVHIESCQERFLDAPPVLVDTIDYTGKMVPCVSLRRLLGAPGNAPKYERVIIVTVDDMKVGLAVDSVLGRQQAVIKSLSEMYDDVDFISGTTVNGHGSISLILDIPQLVRRALRQAEEGMLRVEENVQRIESRDGKNKEANTCGG